MQDVKIEVLESGLWICLSSDCRFKSECANHTTAGDFRTESGFTPKLFERNPGVWACHTIDVPAELPSMPDHPAGPFRSGALLGDGSTCNPHEPPLRTFKEAINDARKALDEAWGKVPVGCMTARPSWQIQDKLSTCRDGLTSILKLVEKPDERC